MPSKPSRTLPTAVKLKTAKLAVAQFGCPRGVPSCIARHATRAVCIQSPRNSPTGLRAPSPADRRQHPIPPHAPAQPPESAASWPTPPGTGPGPPACHPTPALRAANNPQQHRYDGDHQQNVQHATHGERGEHAQGPKNDQDDGNRIQHSGTF